MKRLSLPVVAALVLTACATSPCATNASLS